MTNPHGRNKESTTSTLSKKFVAGSHYALQDTSKGFVATTAAMSAPAKLLKEIEEGDQVTNSWNIEHLRRFYP